MVEESKSDDDLSFDESTNFDNNIDGRISSLSPDDNDNNNDNNSFDKEHDDDDDDDFVIHSLPHPDEIPRTRGSRNKKTSGNKMVQTFASVAGNVLEWYDFAVFGFFSDEIGKVFFPPQEGNADIVESFTVFGLAFLMRPVGGALMGYIGDKYGRKRALEISIFLMAFPTFAMGCLPSYESVGSFATLLLIIVRCLQGLSVGGQLVSSLVFTVEQNPRHQWGLYGSYVMAAANVGTLLGGIVATTLKGSLSDEQLLSFGWRIPFLSGIIVSLSGLYLKYYGDEEIHHSGGGEEGGNGNPLRMAFRKENIRSLISASLVPMLWSGGFYITFVWMATFMNKLIDPPVPNAFLVNSGALFLSVCILFPFAGMLSDIFRRTKVMYVGGILLAILSPIMVYVISQGNAVAAFLAQCAMGIALCLWGAPMMAWLVESFPPAIRLTSVAVGYNIAQAIVGGSSPALATYLVDTYALVAPGYMVSVIAIFSLSGLTLHTLGNGYHQYDNTNTDDRSPPRQSGESTKTGLFNFDGENLKEDENGHVVDIELI